MGTNRDWMYKILDDNYLSEEFVKKVDEFIKVTSEQKHFKKYEKFKCPCDKSWNVPYLDDNTVKLHIYKNGFGPSYYQWTYHGELNMELGVESGKWDVYFK